MGNDSQPQGRRMRVWLKRTWANLVIYTLTFLLKVLPSQLPAEGQQLPSPKQCFSFFPLAITNQWKGSQGSSFESCPWGKVPGQVLWFFPSTGAMVLRPWVLGSDFCLQHSLAIRQVTTSPSFIFLTCEMGTRNSSWQGYYEDK